MLFRWCLVLIVGLVLATMARAEDKPAPPRVAWDFGYLPQKSTVSHVFHLVNSDSTPMAVTRIKSGCSCTSVNEITDAIAPGDSVPIVVTFSSGRYRDRVVKTTRVYTSSERFPEFHFRIEAYVLKRGLARGCLRVEPESLTRRDAKTSDTLTIANDGDHPLTVRMVHVPTAWVDVPAVPAVVDAGAEIKLVVRYLGDPAAVTSALSLSLSFSGSDTTIVTVPVRIED